MDAFIIAAVLVLAYYLYYRMCNAYLYWEKKGIKGPKPQLLFGNFKSVMTLKDSMNSYAVRLYKQYPNEKCIGLYQGTIPVLIVRDPDLVKRVLVKDFPYFADRGFSLTKEPLSKNLFSLDGEEWKVLRQKLTPLFSTSKLKQMMPLLNNCVKEYMQHLDKVVEKPGPHEVRELNVKYTLKAITSVAFGIDIDTFTDDENEFIVMAEKLFAPRGLLRRIAVLIDGLKPGILQNLGIQLTSKEIKDFFLNLVRQIIKEREGKPKVRKDFMDLMIELKEQGTITNAKSDGVTEMEITVEIITAQALLFYAAGFETSASTMTFMLYELAMNQSVQDRCYEEIKQIMDKYKGELTYEALNELEYVSAAFDETLRRHPTAGILLRQCVTNYKVPDMDLVVEKGTKVFVTVQAIHNDPQYFPDPEIYDPTRFLPENKGSKVDNVYMPFGEGPRNCIGLRLAKIQSILGIAHMIHNFRVTPSERTPKTIRYDPRNLLLKSLDGTWLNIERRT